MKNKQLCKKYYIICINYNTYDKNIEYCKKNITQKII